MMTPVEALAVLDSLQPTDEDWNDPAFVFEVSWLMITLIYMRCGRLLDEAGYPVVVWPELA